VRIKPYHRKRLIYYLNEFYKRYPNEKFTIFHYVKYFKARLKNNKDAWVSVSGQTGEGKSYKVLMSMILFGRPMNLIDNVTYLPSGNEIIDKFNKLNFNCLLVDEAAKDLRSVDWYKRSNKDVSTKAMTDRFKNNWIFLNIPNFDELAKSLKRTNIIFRAIVVYRTDTYARVIVQRRSRNWRDEDAWGDKKANLMYKNVQKRHREISNDMILSIERKQSTYVMDFIIPNLELILPDVTDEYQRLKLESREHEEIIDDGKPNPYKDKYENLMAMISKILVHNQLGLGRVRVTKTEIAGKLGIGIQTLNRYLAIEPQKFKKTRGIDGEDK